MIRVTLHTDFTLLNRGVGPETRDEDFHGKFFEAGSGDYAPQTVARRRSRAWFLIDFCSFSKARTSIWRTRSRLMPTASDDYRDAIALAIPDKHFHSRPRALPSYSSQVAGPFMCRLITLVHGAQNGRTSAAMRPTRPLLDGRAQPRGLGVAPIFRNVAKDQREALNNPN